MSVTGSAANSIAFANGKVYLGSWICDIPEGDSSSSTCNSAVLILESSESANSIIVRLKRRK